jgi:hypothetical protein
MLSMEGGDEMLYLIPPLTGIDRRDSCPKNCYTVCPLYCIKIYP